LLYYNDAGLFIISHNHLAPTALATELSTVTAFVQQVQSGHYNTTNSTTCEVLANICSDAIGHSDWATTIYETRRSNQLEHWVSRKIGDKN
jgi:hypothetical protein